MITTETPYKLAEIIRDTWPNLYRYEPQETQTSRESKEEDVYP